MTEGARAPARASCGEPDVHDAMTGPTTSTPSASRLARRTRTSSVPYRRPAPHRAQAAHGPGHEAQPHTAAALTHQMLGQEQDSRPGDQFRAIQDIHNAEDREHAGQAIKTFAKLYGAKFPRAVEKVTDDQDVLLESFDFPAEHWINLRTTNPIESTFATVRLRTKVTPGAGSRVAALAMVSKLAESARAPCRAINGAHLAPVVSAGTRFERAQLVERSEAVAA
ncbi:hypothetical protein C9J60_25080 [Streptomyces sp. A244]|nr:hypothetical protein C9J60_25080 [Streptomyces sp. A244]